MSKSKVGNKSKGLDPEELLKAGIAGDSWGPEDAGNDPALLDPEELAADFEGFEILELLGRGGMGVVYKARHRQLKRLVALKIMTHNLSDQQRFVERFEREGQALARLSHPNIVTLYEFGKAGGRCFMAMEYVEGTNLREVMRAGLEPKQALAIVSQICAALQYAHDKNIVHRDIKPENILLNKAGHAKLADFGLAKILPAAGLGTDPKGSVTIIGTPAYMAPEQIENPTAVDHRADVYAVGVVFYELLTGELPHGIYKPPSEHVRVDVRLDEVVLRALERKPERRYQHVSEIGNSVDTISRTKGKQPKRTSTKFRKQLLWAGIGLFCFFVAITAAWIIPPYLEAQTREKVSRVKARETLDPDAKSLFEKMRRSVIAYQLNFDSVFPGNSFIHRDESRLELFPDGVWPDILGTNTIIPDLPVSSTAIRYIENQNPENSIVSGSVVVRQKLMWPMVANGYSTLLFLDEVGDDGSLVTKSYALVGVSGEMAGIMQLHSYATALIYGDLSGSLMTQSYANVLVTGDLTGTLITDSFAMVYVQGKLAGNITLNPGGFRIGSRLYVESFTPMSQIESIKGKGDIYLAESDVEPGEYEVGQLNVTVGRQRTNGMRTPMPTATPTHTQQSSGMLPPMPTVTPVH